MQDTRDTAGNTHSALYKCLFSQSLSPVLRGEAVRNSKELGEGRGVCALKEAKERELPPMGSPRPRDSHG